MTILEAATPAARFAGAGDAAQALTRALGEWISREVRT